MNGLPELSALFTAFFAGLLGSGHCFGMCGGIAASLGRIEVFDGQEPRSPARTAPRLVAVLLFNLGRLLSYALLGILAAWVITHAGQALHIPHWGRALRLLTAVMIFLIGLQFLVRVRLLAFVENTGARLWHAIMPLALRVAARPGFSGRLLLGLCWGLLPCGLVYSILVTASATGSTFAGALTMLAFGLGTLPSMLGMGLLAPSLGALLSDEWTRRLMGIALILLAIYSIYLLVPGHHSM